MSKPIKLKDCPFCGSKGVRRFEYHEREYRFWVCGVVCGACNGRMQAVASFPDELSHVVGACVRKWNRRAAK